MVAFLSSFACGGGTQAFSAKVQNHGEDVRSTVTIHVNAVFQNVFAWGAMAQLRTWKYAIREVPGAANVATGVVVQILGGPGFGALTIDSYNSWTAMLTDMTLESVNPKSGLIFGRLTFVMQPA
jgi:hypothetical protein